MLSMSIIEMLKVWSELDDCKYKSNKYGKDTCELYFYRFITATPSTFTESEFAEEDFLEASKNLYEILSLYKSMNHCVIKINDNLVGKWLLKEPFRYRVHVTIS